MRTSFWTRIFDLIAPRPCPICGERLSVNESLICAVCHMHLPVTRFQYEPLDNPMARLFWGQFPIERAAAWFYYVPHSYVSTLIYDLKYHGQAEYGIAIGNIIAQRFEDSHFFEGIDALIPIPITRKRRWHRGYNQSEMVAQGISEITGIPIYKKVVRRIHFTGSQTDKDRWQRLENVENVFQLTNPAKIANKHILIIDDIVTTGATISACARQLCKADNVTISVLTIGFTKS